MVFGGQINGGTYISADFTSTTAPTDRTKKNQASPFSQQLSVLRDPTRCVTVGGCRGGRESGLNSEDKQRTMVGGVNGLKMCA